MENIEREIQKKPEENQEINWADVAVQEAVERTRADLKTQQKESRDEFFKRLKIDELTPEALMILNISMEESNEPFPKEIKKKAVQFAMDSPFYPYEFSDPQDRLEYIKDLIIRYPNTFYKKEKGE